MFELEYVLAGVILLALIVYMLTGGADFGGGIWDLFAFGKRGDAQRQVITSAIAPIWEANHVWLIIVIVLLFVCYPAAYAAITTAFHIPLTIMLVGIVFRGSAFVFRAHDDGHPGGQRTWGKIFAISSIITPIMLGIVIGSLATGRVVFNPETLFVQTNFISDWLLPFPFAVGFFTLALCAYLSALYLIFETADPALQQDFRLRAIISAVSVEIIAFICLMLSQRGAPEIYQGLMDAPWSPELPILAASLGVVSIICLFLRWDFAAIIAGMAQVTTFLVGFGIAQFPYLVVPGLTILEAAAPESILKPVLAALVIGAAFLVPSFSYLYYVFKGRNH